MSGKKILVLLQRKKQTGFFFPNKRKEKQKEFVKAKGLVYNNNLDLIIGEFLSGVWGIELVIILNYFYSM